MHVCVVRVLKVCTSNSRCGRRSNWGTYKMSILNFSSEMQNIRYYTNMRNACTKYTHFPKDGNISCVRKHILTSLVQAGSGLFGASSFGGVIRGSWGCVMRGVYGDDANVRAVSSSWYDVLNKRVYLKYISI